MHLRIRGAREHTLAGVDLDLPHQALIVFTGPSGSGKSSLAFDTLHAESRRRFVEALAGNLRAQFGGTHKPAFDLLTGLTPSIGVAQGGLAAPHPRATVGSLVEIHDLLRVLWGRTGRQHCPRCDADVTPRTVDAVLAELSVLPEGTRLVLCAPVARGRTGPIAPLVAELNAQGFARLRVDRVSMALDEARVDDPSTPYDVDVVIDRLKWAPDKRDRLQEAVGVALSSGHGAVVAECDGVDRAFTVRARCVACAVELPELSPRLFSTHSPLGACPACQGVGTVVDVDLDALVVDADLSVAAGALDAWKGTARTRALATLRERGVDVDAAWSSLSWEHRELVLHGDPVGLGRGVPPPATPPAFEGAVAAVRRRGDSPALAARPCPTCAGTRMSEAARSARVAGTRLERVLGCALSELPAWLGSLPRDAVTAPIVDEIGRRLDVLLRTGLGYVTLARRADTLSGGELQRVRLAAQAGNQLSGVLYVLDEPTAGLHPQDTAALLSVLRDLRDAGNTVLVVEHDPDVIDAADLVVDFGPGAGREGGRVVFQGTPAELRAADTLTGRWLSGRLALPPRTPRAPRGHLVVEGATGHNLRDVTVPVPLGMLVGVAGPSGAGKSSLVEDTLARALEGRADALPHRALRGRETVTRLVRVDASPLGRSRRSNPATATKVWDSVRDLLSRTAEARVRGFGPERFSLAVPGGRCEACEGEGVRRIELQLLPDVEVPCEVCDGRRFDEATLSVTWHGHSAGDLLAMPIHAARALFAAVPAVSGMLATLDALGLGYLPLGQRADTL
ncbi:MAG: hypothetical protein RLZZ299_1889, partial [Pseudomonadota bacterium]